MPRRTAPTARARRDRRREKRRDYRLRLRERRQGEALASLQQGAEDLHLAQDPATPAEAAAAALGRVFEHYPPAPEVTEELLGGAGSERARAVAEAALQAGPSLVALTLGADVAIAAGDLGGAEDHLVRLGEAGDHPFVSMRMARVLAARGRVVDAVERLNQALAEEPGRTRAQLFRGELLASLAAWEAEPPDGCPCASGRPYAACCGEAGSRLLAEFRDRQPLSELRRAVLAFVAQRPRLYRAVHASLDEWIEAGTMPRAEVEEGSALVHLALERAFVTPLDGEQEVAVLHRFADDDEAPPQLASWASDWGASVTFGLWQVGELGEPGVALTDYLTGQRVYASLAAEQREGLRPWMVLLGCVGHLDGVWRTGPAFCEMSPAEARTLALPLARFVERMAAQTSALAALMGPAAEWATRMREELGRGSWLPDRVPPAPPLIARAFQPGVQRLLPRLVGQFWRMKESPAGLANTDGDPLEFIEARLSLADPKRARAALAKHPDFEDWPPIGTRWLGRGPTPAQRQQMLAAAGSDGTEVDDGQMSRWHRATLRWQSGDLLVEVNSRRRLERLLALLADLGHPARVVDEQVTELTPALREGAGLPPAAEVEARPLDPEMEEAWLQALAGEPVPALDGLTAGEAAERDGYAERLEAFVRELEHRHGTAGLAPLRRELGLGG
jgi:hypothetical protein